MTMQPPSKDAQTSKADQLTSDPSTAVAEAATASSSSSSSAFSSSSSDLAHVHPSAPTTGKPVVWEQLEDGFCCVCEEGDGSEDNPIVFCDSCNMSVHKECYGNPLVNRIPDDSWVCERCRWQAQDESCALCPVRYGAMKRTTDWQWAHLVCAQWIPEVFFRLPEGRDQIDLLMTPLRRHTQTCIYCGQACGVCVECSEPGCKRYFHITCGQRNEIFLEYTQKNNGADVIVSYCREHGKRWHNKRHIKSVVRASRI